MRKDDIVQPVVDILYTFLFNVLRRLQVHGLGLHTDSLIEVESLCA